MRPKRAAAISLATFGMLAACATEPPRPLTPEQIVNLPAHELATRVLAQLATTIWEVEPREACLDCIGEAVTLYQRPRSEGVGLCRVQAFFTTLGTESQARNYYGLKRRSASFEQTGEADAERYRALFLDAFERYKVVGALGQVPEELTREARAKFLMDQEAACAKLTTAKGFFGVEHGADPEEAASLILRAADELSKEQTRIVCAQGCSKVTPLLKTDLMRHVGAPLPCGAENNKRCQTIDLQGRESLMFTSDGAGVIEEIAIYSSVH